MAPSKNSKTPSSAAVLKVELLRVTDEVLYKIFLPLGHPKGLLPRVSTTFERYRSCYTDIYKQDYASNVIDELRGK